MISGRPMSPAWMMWWTPARRCSASGRSSPWVSEMTPALSTRRAFLVVDRHLLHHKPEQRTQPRTQDVTDEGGDEPAPAVQAAGGDTAEIGADIAAIGEPRAVAEQQS